MISDAEPRHAEVVWCVPVVPPKHDAVILWRAILSHKTRGEADGTVEWMQHVVGHDTLLAGGAHRRGARSHTIRRPFPTPGNEQGDGEAPQHRNRPAVRRGSPAHDPRETVPPDAKSRQAVHLPRLIDGAAWRARLARPPSRWIGSDPGQGRACSVYSQGTGRITCRDA